MTVYWHLPVVPNSISKPVLSFRLPQLLPRVLFIHLKDHAKILTCFTPPSTMLAPKLIQSPTPIIAARVFFLSCYSLQFSLFQRSDIIPASLALAMSSLLLCLSVLSSSRSIWMFCLSSTMKFSPSHEAANSVISSLHPALTVRSHC